MAHYCVYVNPHQDKSQNKGLICSEIPPGVKPGKGKAFEEFTFEAENDGEALVYLETHYKPEDNRSLTGFTNLRECRARLSAHSDPNEKAPDPVAVQAAEDRLAGKHRPPAPAQTVATAEATVSAVLSPVHATARQPHPPSRPAQITLPECLCGCGEKVGNPKSKFRPGHDARYHSRLRRQGEWIARAKLEYDVNPTEALQLFNDAHHDAKVAECKLREDRKLEPLPHLTGARRDLGKYAPRGEQEESARHLASRISDELSPERHHVVDQEALHELLELLDGLTEYSRKIFTEALTEELRTHLRG